jgi:hypothetical protein
MKLLAQSSSTGRKHPSRYIRRFGMKKSGEGQNEGELLDSNLTRRLINGDLQGASAVAGNNNAELSPGWRLTEVVSSFLH